jgi:hypothetical protein
MDRSSTEAPRPAYQAAFFIALFATALAFGAALAHALELPNKIDLPREAYFVVQAIYRGWDALGYLLAVQLLSMIAVAVMARGEPVVRCLAITAILALLMAICTRSPGEATRANCSGSRIYFMRCSDPSAGVHRGGELGMESRG